MILRYSSFTIEYTFLHLFLSKSNLRSKISFSRANLIFFNFQTKVFDKPKDLCHCDTSVSSGILKNK